MKIGLAAAGLLVAGVFYFRLRSAPATEATTPLAPVVESDHRAPAAGGPETTSAPVAAPKSGPMPGAPMPKSGKKIRGTTILAPGSKPTSGQTWSGMEPDPNAGVDPTQGPDPSAGAQKPK